MKTLINVRGAFASGKTTVVRKFCESHNPGVETLKIKQYSCPVTVMDGGKHIAIGDYTLDGCTGCDRYSGKEQIKAAIRAASIKYNPDTIIFEGMLASQLYKTTAEIASVARQYGYEYRGIWVRRSRESREEMLFKRNQGIPHGMKNFYINAQRVSRTARRLAANGYTIIPVNVESIPEAEMGGLIERAIR